MKKIFYALSWGIAPYISYHIHRPLLCGPSETQAIFYKTSLAVMVISFLLPLIFCLTNNSERQDRRITQFKAYPFWIIPITYILPLIIMLIASTYAKVRY